MELKKKNILLISPEPWDHIFVSKHHYATHLAKKGNNIYFLNPPSDQKKVMTTKYKNVYSVNYKGFPKGLRFYPSLIQQYFIQKMFNRVQKWCNVEFDIVWSFDNSVFFDFSALPKRVLKISHIVDLNQNFKLAQAADTADFCFGVIPLIVSRLKANNEHSFLINHGVQPFNKTGDKQTVPGNNKLKAMYIGNLKMKFIDWSLLHILVKQNKNVDFIFLGENTTDYSDFFIKENVYYLGKVKAEEIPAFLKSSDILLLTYSEDYYTNYATPHKMMEYLASGKMVVATKTMEYNTLAEKELIIMSEQNSDFPDLFREVITEIEEWNIPEKQNMRKAFALDNTYDRQITRIENIINKNDRND